VLSKHAVEKRDAKMAGRCLAGIALIGQGWWHEIEDCLYLFDEYYEETSDGGEKVKAVAREFYLSGVRRRPRRILRAEAVGLVWALRWLYRAGLLERRAVQHAYNRPFIRSREGQRRQAFWDREEEHRAGAGRPSA
jgi:hypothetical protein